MVPWMKYVERVTEGRVKVKLLPKPVTNAINHFDAVRDGLADVAFVSHAYTPARFQFVRRGQIDAPPVRTQWLEDNSLQIFGGPRFDDEPA